MKIVADENVPIDSVIILREEGHDVDSIQESCPTISDVEVLARAVQSESVLLTFDRDFGDLLFNKKLPAPIGVIYLRFDQLSSEEPARIVLDLFNECEIEGYLTVVTRFDIRQRALFGIS